MFPDLLAGNVRHHRRASRASRPTSRRASCSARPSASRCAPIALEVGQLQETVTVTVRSGAGADHQRRPLGPGRPRADRRHRGEGARLRQLPQAAARRRRHQRARGARLGQHGRPLDQRPHRRLQLLLRRRHQQGHRLEQRQLRRAGARLDRRSPRPDLELPGRVRPQLRRDRSRSSPAAARRTSTAAPPTTSATTPGTATSSRRRRIAVWASRPSANRRTTISTTPPGRWAGRCCCRARPSTAAATSCSSSGRRTSSPAPTRAACKERRMPTQLERSGDFSQSFDNQGRLLFIRDPQLAGNCSVTAGGPACFPGNIIPPTASTRRRSALLNLFPLPNTDADQRQLQQLHLPDRAGLAAQRPGAAHRLQHRAEHDDVRPVAVRLREARRPGLVPRLRRRMAAAAEQVRDRHGQLRQHAAPHLQPDAVRRSDGRRELGAPVHQRVRRRGARRQRPADRAARVPAVLPAGEPRRDPAERDVHRRHSGNGRAVQHRQPLAVLRLQHAVELLGQHHQDRRLAQHQGGAVRRAHDASGPARLDLQRHAVVQHRRIESAEHQRRIRQRPARGGHASIRSRTVTPRRTASS